MLYPPPDKVSVFLMSVTVITVALAHPDLNSLLAEAVVKNFGDPGRVFYATLVTTAVSLLFLGPLILPFTHQDMRVAASIVLPVNAAVMAAANLTFALSQESVLLAIPGWIGAAFGGAWFLPRPDRLAIADSEPAPRDALYAAGICIGLLLVGIYLLHLSWPLSYAFAVALSITVYRAAKDVLNRAT
jgi:hypothetical protein